jgi:hypothetical protein
MSQFYDLASLVVIPSGYKASTIYAQKPLTTDGQLSFTRASTATRVNSSGLIETVASNVPRLDYTNSSCPRLNLEPQRTNSIVHSNALASAGWLTFGGTQTNNSGVSPDGTNNATLFSSSGSVAAGAYQNVAATSGQTVTVSAYFKLGTATNICLVINNAFAWDTVGGEVFTTANGLSTTAWKRVTFTFTAPATNQYNIHIGQHGQSGLASQSLGTFYVYGVQAEVGGYATSLIPTTTAAVTRVADAASKTGISSLIGQTEGVIFLDFVASAQNQDGAGYAALTIFGTATDNIQLYNIGTTLYWYARNTAGLLIDQAANETLVAGQRYKIAYAYKSGDYVLYINGVQKRTYTGSAVPAVSQFNLCGTGFGAVSAGVKNEFSQMLLFKTRLTNAQLAELTAL